MLFYVRATQPSRYGQTMPAEISHSRFRLSAVRESAACHRRFTRLESESKLSAALFEDTRTKRQVKRYVT